MTDRPISSISVLAAATDVVTTESGASREQQRIAAVAAEFEGMLLTHILREMRNAGKWDEESESLGLGADTLYETIDVELATHLARIQGIGLAQQLMDAFDRIPERTSLDATPPPAERSDAVLSVTSTTAARVDTLREDRPAATAASGPLTEKITSAYGWRRDPLNGQPRFHRGIDLRAAYGEPVTTPAPGRVVFNGTQGGYGTTVIIEHDGGVRTRYAHLSTAPVPVGQEVVAGQAVGQAGQSGRATGPHVHFEVIVGGRAVDPREWRQSALTRLKETRGTADSRVEANSRTGEMRGEDYED